MRSRRPVVLVGLAVAAAVAVAAGYLQGYPDGSFRPQAAATRAQAASILAEVPRRPATTGAAGVSAAPERWSAGSVDRRS